MPATMSLKGAVAIAQRMFGSSGGVRDTRRASSPELRAEASAALAAHRALKPALPEMVRGSYPDEMPFAEVMALRATQIAALREWRKVESELVGTALTGYRYAVGLSSVMSFQVMGEGDTWEEAFEKATARAGR